MAQRWVASTFAESWPDHEPGCPLTAPCDECREKHRRTPGSCAPEALASWKEVFSAPLRRGCPPVVPVHLHVVPVIHGNAARYRIAERFPDVDTWAVPLHKAMNLKGEVRSADLKDYLGLSTRHRLILSTVSPDPFLEALWRLGGSFDYRAHGVDLIFPGHFSTYDLDGPAYGVFNVRRQQIHAERVGSPWTWFRLGAYVPLRCFDAVRDHPNVLVSCQQMNTLRARALLFRELAVADWFFPPTTRFWFVSQARNVPVPRAATSVFLNHRWLMTGLFGRDLANRPLPHMSIEEVLVHNLRSLLERHRR